MGVSSWFFKFNLTVYMASSLLNTGTTYMSLYQEKAMQQDMNAPIFYRQQKQSIGKIIQQIILQMELMRLLLLQFL